MTHIKRLILAFVLSCGLAPAFAQAPPPVPALPDTERRTSYSISATTCACNVNFALYGDSTDYQNWVEVWLNGVQIQYNDANFGWRITSPTGPLASIARPITDAVLTFNSAQTGTVQIVGARRPRRVSQFSESRGVAARDLNQALTDIVAQNRETWDKTNDVTGRAVVAPPGETMSVLPPLASRANKGACFDVNGYLQPCTAISSSTTLTAGNGIQFSGSNPLTITNNIQGGQSIGVTGTNPLTVSLLANALNFLLNATCVATPSTCTSLLGYANPIWWSADPTGVSASQSAINSAAATGKLVEFTPGGTYRITGTVFFQPNQRWNCNGSTIIQGNGANLGPMIDISTNTPLNFQLDHCVIDGNAANNTINPATDTVTVSGISRGTINNNTFQNAPGGNLVIGTSSYVTVDNNYCANGISYCVAILNATLGTRSYHTVTNNVAIGPMLHLFQIDNTDGNYIANNRMIQGLATTGTVINVSGTAITWVSGPNFSTLTKGQVIVANGGTEFQIASINSNTSVTATASGGTLTGVPAAFGGGDVMSMTSTSYNRITGNFVSGGATGGIVLSNQGGALGTVGAATSNLISNNNIENSGFAAIALEAPSAAGNPQIAQTSIVGNNIISPGRTGTAGTTGTGIQLSSAAGLMPGVIVMGNYVYDPFGISGGFWLSGTGSANATLVQFVGNIPQGFVNGSSMSGYPTFASLPLIRGQTSSIIDGIASQCGDTTCTTWGTTVTGGNGLLKLTLNYNGTNFTLMGK